MSPQAVRITPSPRRSWRLPRRAWVTLLVSLVLMLALGRGLLPLAILIALSVAAVMWYGPEIAYWLDDTLWLHRVPGFGLDHRQMALASFAYLSLAALLGGVALGGAGQRQDPAEPTATATPELIEAPAVDGRPGAPAAESPPEAPVSTPPTEPSQSDPAPAAGPAVPTATVVGRQAAAPTALPQPRPTQPLPALKPTFTPVAPATIAPAATGAPTKPAAPTSTLTRGGPPAELTAQIVGVSTVAAAGSKATLQARATPGATCELSVQYAGDAAEGAGVQRADGDGLCTFGWTIPANAPSGWAIASVTVKLGGKSKSGQISFTVR